MAGIEQRLSLLTGLPAEPATGLQVIRYEKGQAFDAHYDNFSKEVLQEHPNTSQRLASVIIYLCVLSSNFYLNCFCSKVLLWP